MTFEQHLQQSCGAEYLFQNIVDNLNPDELAEELLSFAEKQNGNIVSFDKEQFMIVIQLILKLNSLLS